MPEYCEDRVKNPRSRAALKSAMLAVKGLNRKCLQELKIKLLQEEEEDISVGDQMQCWSQAYPGYWMCSITSQNGDGTFSVKWEEDPQEDTMNHPKSHFRSKEGHPCGQPCKDVLAAVVHLASALQKKVEEAPTEAPAESAARTEACEHQRHFIDGGLRKPKDFINLLKTLDP